MVFLLDLGVILILAFTAWRGWTKGLILTLCGLLAVILSFVGANYISDHFTEPVAGFLQPYISDHLEDALEALPAPSVKPSAAPAPTFTFSPPEEETERDEAPDATFSELLKVVRSSKVFSRLSPYVESAVEDGSLKVVTTAVSAVSALLARQVARVGLFFLSFLVIAVVCWLFGYMVDLAFHLPVLRTLNEAGGLALGIAKGLIILVVLCWGLVTFDMVPAATAERTHLFSLFLRFQII